MPGAEIRRPAFADYEGEASCKVQPSVVRWIVKAVLRNAEAFNSTKRERIAKQ